MTLEIDGTLLLAGAGNMGSAMLAGWLQEGLAPSQIIVQDPAPPPRATELLARRGLTAQKMVRSLPHPPAVIVVAVKPQVMDEVFPGLAKLAGSSTVVLSIAAGRTIASFASHLPENTAVVRAMPNTPAAVGRGITVGVANAYVTPGQRVTCDALLRAVGEVSWIDDESLIDAVTAVSGSGPAYVFYLAECLADAAVKVGLPLELAQKLARATVAGSGELLNRSDLGADVLRQNVTSPGGTTYAALQVLMARNGGLPELMREAVAAAARRSRELAK
jgi:pyrroline-5-carboxylate reductase